MAVYSGKDAYVNGVACTKSWGVSDAVSFARYAASCLGGGTNTPPGVANLTGQMTGYGAFPSAVLPSLTPLSFQGVINNTSGSLKSITGSVFIESLTIDINRATRAAIAWTATFGVHGDIAEASSGAADAVVSEAENGKDLSIKIAESALTQNIQTAQIVLRRPLATYVDAGLTYRSPGNLECDINFSLLESSLNVAAYARNALSNVKIYTTATEYWDLQKIRFGGKTNFNVDRETNNITGYTVNGQWNAVEGTTAGFISYYNGSAYETAVHGTNPS